MKSAIFCLIVVSFVMSSVQARDYRERNPVTAQVAREIWDVYEFKTNTYSPSNAYLCAHAVQAMAQHEDGGAIAGNFFDQVVRIDGGKNMPQVVVGMWPRRVASLCGLSVRVLHELSVRSRVLISYSYSYKSLFRLFRLLARPGPTSR